MANIQWIGLKELETAINRNPQKVMNEADLFLTRGMATYKSGIINNPWRIGGTGGGSPVSNDPRYKRKYQRQRSGNLRDSHIVKSLGRWQKSIGPNTLQAPYASYVFAGTKKMQARPWLDYVKRNKDTQIQKLYRQMLQNIVSDLAH